MKTKANRQKRKHRKRGNRQRHPELRQQHEGLGRKRVDTGHRTQSRK